MRPTSIGDINQAVEMLALFEMPADLAILKLLDGEELKQTKDLETVDKARKVIKRKMFDEFEDASKALALATTSVQDKMSKGLKGRPKRSMAGDAHEKKLSMADAKLGNATHNMLDLSGAYDSRIVELMRRIWSQAGGLMSGLVDKKTTARSLDLAHSLSRGHREEGAESRRARDRTRSSTSALRTGWQMPFKISII